MEVLDILRAWRSPDGKMIHLRVETEAGPAELSGHTRLMESLASTITRHAAQEAELRSGIIQTTLATGVAVNTTREGVHVLSLRHADGLQAHYEVESRVLEALRVQLSGLRSRSGDQ